MKAKRFSHVFHDDGSVQQTSRTLGSRSLAQHRRSTAYLASKKRIEVWYYQACPNHINQKNKTTTVYQWIMITRVRTLKKTK
jgi:hypothetical protein